MLQTYFEALLTALLDFAEVILVELAEDLLRFGLRLSVMLALVLIATALAAAAKCFRSRTPPSDSDPSRRASAPD